jgi:A/G-specific adenine glycosylase
MASARQRETKLHDSLLSWYARERRDLPWRRTSDPYSILVSEVMLQQTQAARVVPRWLAWLERWPTVEALAAERSSEVVREWVGLGYNRRALALHAAAVSVAREGWPEDLRRLPGVGPYTAAAVGAFAFGRQVAAVDTNVRRVAQRLGGDPARPAEDLLAPGRAAEWNQAMMELGATICTARRPRCEACPLRRRCASAGRVVPGPPPARPRERFEDSNRWVRGQVVAALAAGRPVPDIDPARLRPALAGLEGDALIVRNGDAVRLR